MKLITDTLQEKSGKWSIKRVSSFSSFWLGVVYAFLPAFIPFEIQEFVFWGFMSFAATGILGSVWNKKIDKPT